ncbi:MAG: hypothetical protein K2M89_00930 [Clostridiales bacterium]|nr:hypothetical protein [Clostridiales bacterium]
MKKVIQSIAIIVVGLFIMTGCRTGNGNIAYNAVLYNADNWINEDFANDNMIRNIHYYDDEHNEIIFTNDESYPSSRTFIVENLEDYDKIFINNINELDVDFNKQMLIVYTFMAISRKKLTLVSTDLQDKKLKITYKSISKAGVGDTCMPYQRWIVIKQDKVEVESVEFVSKIEFVN